MNWPRIEKNQAWSVTDKLELSDRTIGVTFDFLSITKIR